MLSKRVIVIAGDKPLQKRLIAGVMAAGGAVQVFAAPEEASGRIDADLVLCAYNGESAYASLLARMPEEARLVPVIPAPRLESMVALLGDPRVPAALVAENLSVGMLTSALAKLLYGDLFGLEKLMPWGVRIYSALVGDYQEKSLAIASIGDFAEALGVRRKYREQIDQCIDEMLMNALYDAPVDEQGKPLFAEVPVRERVLLKVTEKAVVQYACDGDRFAVSVRDSFGTLQKKTVLAYLDKCLHAEGSAQIDRKAGGAGLGLYLIANAATELYFHIFEGSATEVVCLFDLSAPRSQLRCLSVFTEAVDTARRPAFGSTRTVSARRGRRREDLTATPRPSLALPAMMTAAVLLLAIAVALAAYPYLRQPPRAALRVETDPPGATVFLEGRSRGSSPITIDALEAGRSYAVRTTLPGHQEDDQLVTAAAGESTVRLRLPALVGSAAVDSDPPGARVIVDGKETGKLTPTTVELEPGKPAQVLLKKDGFLEQTLAVSGPGAGERAVYRTTLSLSPEVSALVVEVAPAAATITVDGLALMPPEPRHETFIRPGVKHLVKASAPGFLEAHEELQLGAGERRTLRFALAQGGLFALRTNVTARVIIDDRLVGTSPVGALALSAGRHTVALRAARPLLDYRTTVTVEKGKTLEARFDFGTLEIKAPDVVVQPPGGGRGATLLALPVGPQRVALTNQSTGERRERELTVEPGGKTIIDSW